jgi:hypothetical protein
MKLEYIETQWGCWAKFGMHKSYVSYFFDGRRVFSTFLRMILLSRCSDANFPSNAFSIFLKGLLLRTFSNVYTLSIRANAQ